MTSSSSSVGRSLLAAVALVMGSGGQGWLFQESVLLVG